MAVAPIKDKQPDYGNVIVVAAATDSSSPADVWGQ